MELTVENNVVEVTLEAGEGYPTPGPPGKSAYQVAVENGFEGTESEWVDYISANGQEAQEILGQVESIQTDVAEKQLIATSAAESAEQSAASANEDKIEVQQLKSDTETIKEEAQSARDEIADQIDFSDLQPGDILRRDGNKLVRMSEVEFLRRKEAYRRSPIAAIHDLKDYQVWDSFDRADGLISTSDSGHTWQKFLSTIDWSIENRKLKSDSNGQTGIGLPWIPINTGSLEVKCTIITNLGNTWKGGCFIAKNNENYFAAYFSTFSIYVEKVIGGVTTLIAEVSRSEFGLSNSEWSNGLEQSFFNIKLGLHCSTTRMYLSVDVTGLSRKSYYDVTGEMININGSEISIVGISNRSHNSAKYNSFYAKNINR